MHQSNPTFVMEATGFTIEYHTESIEFTNGLKAKLEKRLDKLVGRHRDITGASLAVHTVSGDNRHHEFKVRLVLYHRPDNIAAVCKADTVSNAVLEALDAVERQVREHRERQRERNRARRR